MRSDCWCVRANQLEGVSKKAAAEVNHLLTGFYFICCLKAAEMEEMQCKLSVWLQRFILRRLDVPNSLRHAALMLR